VETGYPPSVAEFVELIKEVDHPAVGATLDVGHQARYVELQQRVKGLAANSPDAIRAYNDVNVELVRALGDKLVHLHVHDIEPSTWREHQPLRYGFVDYPRLLAALRELRYPGSMVLEIAGSPLEMPRYLREAKRKLEGYVATACKG
jgi:sugar phosphate isomerase/epimerase